VSLKLTEQLVVKRAWKPAERRRETERVGQSAPERP
jgi:hypothetical protein